MNEIGINYLKNKSILKIKGFTEFYFPDIQDNFYYNCLDIYSNTKLALATKNYIHILNPDKKEEILKTNKNNVNINLEVTDYTKILEEESIEASFYIKEVSCLKFLNQNEIILCQKNEGIKIMDLQSKSFHHNLILKNYFKNKQINTIENNENLLFFGSEKSTVHFYDKRVKTFPKILYNHKADNEVCKIRYSPQNNFLISGGNDNKIIIYDFRKNQVINNFENDVNNSSLNNINLNFQIQKLSSQNLNEFFMHKAAVKGLDFNNSEDILASGGGTNDKIIKIWDLKRLYLLDQLTTDSQISNINFIDKDSFLVSSGYISNDIVNYKFDYKKAKDNYLLNFDYPDYDSLLLKSCVFEKHKKRILFMSKSKNDDCLASCSSDGVVKIFSYAAIKDKKDFNKNGIVNYPIRI